MTVENSSYSLQTRSLGLDKELPHNCKLDSQPGDIDKVELPGQSLKPNRVDHCVDKVTSLAEEHEKRETFSSDRIGKDLNWVGVEKSVKGQVVEEVEKEEHRNDGFAGSSVMILVE
ncbi:hypothetical protein HG531_009044 [Fusarium graminearum]|nr:hypothetical protein HG531_009044 [Fusarium graminearum]